MTLEPYSNAILPHLQGTDLGDDLAWTVKNRIRLMCPRLAPKMLSTVTRGL